MGTPEEPTPVLPSSVSSRQALLNDRAGWFGEGALRRREARRSHQCVECSRALGSPRAVYCSPRCRRLHHARYFWDAARRSVLRRDGYRCRACGRRLRARELEVDHVRELVRGGKPLDPENLQSLCRPCHRAKTVPLLRLLPGRSLGPDRSADGLYSGLGEMVFVAEDGPSGS
jgi:5-methylcytosine-specific restriction endonuclease McrA